MALMNLGENILVGTGEEGEGGTSWESSTDISTLPCVKQRVGGEPDEYDYCRFPGGSTGKSGK